MFFALLGATQSGFDDGPRNQIAVSTAQLIGFSFFTAGDHHDGRDQHLAQNVALLIVVILFIGGRHRLCDLVQGFHELVAFGKLIRKDPCIDHGLLLSGVKRLHDFRVQQQVLCMHEGRQ
ncbi:hypothetical protein D3C72_1842230 [compost metagenome]